VSSEGNHVGVCDACAAWDDLEDGGAGSAVQQEEDDAAAAAEQEAADLLAPGQQDDQELAPPLPPVIANGVNGHFAVYRWEATAQQYELFPDFVQRRSGSMLQVCVDWKISSSSSSTFCSVHAAHGTFWPDMVCVRQFCMCMTVAVVATLMLT